MKMSHLDSRYPPSKLTFFGLMVLLILAVGVGKTTTVVYAQTGGNVVAVVNGRKITESEVDRSIAAQLIPLQQQIYSLRKIAMENLILRTLLEDEAKKRGLSLEVLKRELTGTKVEVAQGDIEQAYAENRQAFGTMSEDEAKERLRLDLESEARMRNYSLALSKLKQRAHIQLSLAEPELPISNTIEENTPSAGDKSAAVTIIEFSDFQCPFCKDSQSTLKKVLQTYGNNVRLVFKHLPLEIHPQALPSARAAFCAGEQKHFWQYHDALFASGDLSREIFNKIAATLGLDLQKFKMCFDSESSRLAVLKDMQEARRLGINATPSFIINGTLVRGTLNFDDFNGIIARKIKASQLTNPSQ
jgi:protein-disulfide isomerase